MELPQIKQRSSPSIMFNHRFNKVSYSVEERAPISKTYSVQRSSSQSQSFSIDKQLKKIRLIDRQRESLGKKLEQRMRKKRTRNLDKIFQDNMKMFSRIYTQKSHYASSKNYDSYKQSHDHSKQNCVQQFYTPQQSKIKRMRMLCNPRPKQVPLYICQQFNPLKSLNIPNTQALHKSKLI